jgi:hypothetical protein
VRSEEVVRGAGCKVLGVRQKAQLGKLCVTLCDLCVPLCKFFFANFAFLKLCELCG